jgi:anti-sigma regulatory factor (Ser/Thr protein kinase)
MLTGAQLPALSAAPMMAAWVLPGRADQVSRLRRRVGALTAAAGCAPADPQLAVAELFANAVTHSRSGLAGGVVTVIVAAGPAWAVMHVHDQGADDDQVPHLGPRRPTALGENGRGLRLVAAMSALWGFGPAVWCGQAGPEDPAVVAGGCCVWCLIRPAASGATPGDAAGKVPRPPRGGAGLIADGARGGQLPRLLGGGEGRRWPASARESPAARQ